MSDEGFHEIQLNGKQLVFLFMAATVVSVVIFLCGVMVGRGVRAESGSMEAAEPSLMAAPETADAGRPEDAARRAGAPSAGPEPPATDEGDVYQQLMAGNDGKGETLKPKAERVPTASKSAETIARPSPPPETTTAAKAAKADTPKPAPAAEAAQAPAVARPDRGPTDPNTFAVQIAALRERSEADAIAKRLAAKGYAAYVLVPPVGGTPVYKVQVGRFKNRQDAEKTAARLKKEEQFSPWVTR
jgi:cell division septation protein DedD